MIDFLQRFFVDFWDVLLEMSPYLLLGFLVAGVLSVVLRPSLVERHLGGKGLLQTIKASAFGVPLPLCSCGVIPVAASLRRHGAGKGATTAFLISTPQTGVDSILVTYGLLGWVYAIFRPIAALVSGILGGMAVGVIDPHSEKEDRRIRQEAGATDAEASEGPAVVRAARYALVTLPRDIGMALLVGLAIAALISALIQPGDLPGVLGGGIVAMLIMMLAGIPVYVCATASVPIAAALISRGVSPGAALVFLMTGPATNAAAIAMLWKTLGRRSAIAYLLAVAISALLAGVALDYVFRVSGASPQPPMMEMLPYWLKLASAIVLLGMLVSGAGWPWLRKLRKVSSQQPLEAGSEVCRLEIEGMSCSHCSTAVREALMDCPGVQAADVDHVDGSAVVRGDELDGDVLAAAVDQLGYKAADAEVCAAGPPESCCSQGTCP